MSKRCDECRNARAVSSENGIHYSCTLSNKRQERCFMTERFFKPRNIFSTFGEENKKAGERENDR